MNGCVGCSGFMVFDSSQQSSYTQIIWICLVCKSLHSFARRDLFLFVLLWESFLSEWMKGLGRLDLQPHWLDSLFFFSVLCTTFLLNIRDNFELLDVCEEQRWKKGRKKKPKKQPLPSNLHLWAELNPWIIFKCPANARKTNCSFILCSSMQSSCHI